jgi:hypothetical protein
MIDELVAPLDHMLSVKLEDVSVTLSPSQIVVGPLEDIVGVEGEPGSLNETEIELDSQPLLKLKL